MSVMHNLSSVDEPPAPEDNLEDTSRKSTFRQPFFASSFVVAVVPVGG